MQVIDLTHIMETGMPVFPGTEPAGLLKAATLETEGYNETLLHLSSHTGTHIDCGRHFINESFDTGSAAPERFIGKGLVIDCRKVNNQRIISQSHLQPFEYKLKSVDFVLLHTGWSNFWGKDDYFRGFPVLDAEAAGYLTRFNLKGIGTDAISFDTMDSHDYAVHKILLSSGMVLAENLDHLGKLPADGFLFCCFPLKIMDGDGSPVRAVGIVMSDE
jgi:arylformamidase